MIQVEMKQLKVLFLILVPLAWNCKQKPPKAVQPKQETEVRHKVPSIIKELMVFADTVLTDTTDMDKLIHFKEINENGDVITMDLDKCVRFYKALGSSKQAKILPILEIKNTDKAILTVQGRGYTDGIWGKILMDRSTGEIKKLEFGHRAESEGYGEQFIHSSFEYQFVGTTVNLEANSFGLDQNGQQIEGGRMIDGISGATVTVKAAVKMLNEGLQKYRPYLGKP